LPLFVARSVLLALLLFALLLLIRVAFALLPPLTLIAFAPLHQVVMGMDMLASQWQLVVRGVRVRMGVKLRRLLGRELLDPAFCQRAGAQLLRVFQFSPLRGAEQRIAAFAQTQARFIEPLFFVERLERRRGRIRI
jgi:hypothetical protein